MSTHKSVQHITRADEPSQLGVRAVARIQNSIEKNIEDWRGLVVLLMVGSPITSPSDQAVQALW